MRISCLCLAGWLLALAAAPAQTNNPSPSPPGPTNGAADPKRAEMLQARGEMIRNECIATRRTLCGRVLEIRKDGLVVDSGYTALTLAPLNRSWVVRGTVEVTRDAAAVEGNFPAAPALGLVLLTDFPKRPAVKLYDYVTVVGYPTGKFAYTPVPGVTKEVRRFAGKLPAAVRWHLEALDPPGK